VAVKIRLKRLGKIRSPHYRIVVMDARQKRDGRAIEEIGLYHPKNDPSLIQVNSERAQYWLGVGAQPTEAVVALFKRSGDWQAFTGDDSPTGIEPQKERPDRLARYNAAVQAAPEEAIKVKKSTKKADDTSATDTAEKPAKKTKAKAEETAEAAIDVTEDIVEKVEETASALTEEAAEKVADVAETVEEAKEVVADKVSETAEEVAEKVAEVAEEAKQDVVETAEEIVEAVAEAVEEATEKAEG
jgi:small subunit ribosomal protein S16